MYGKHSAIELSLWRANSSQNRSFLIIPLWMWIPVPWISETSNESISDAPCWTLPWSQWLSSILRMAFLVGPAREATLDKRLFLMLEWVVLESSLSAFWNETTGNGGMFYINATGAPRYCWYYEWALAKANFQTPFRSYFSRIGSLCRKRYNGPIKYPRGLYFKWAWTMSPEQSQYIWRKTIPHIEVGMGSGVFTSHRSARNL